MLNDDFDPSEVSTEEDYDWHDDIKYPSMFARIEAAQRFVDDTDPIVDATVPIALLKEYSDSECLRCHFCNRRDPREQVPYMAWSASYLYIVNKHYEDRDHYDKIMIFANSKWGSIRLTNDGNIEPTGIPHLYDLPAGYVTEGEDND